MLCHNRLLDVQDVQMTLFVSSHGSVDLVSFVESVRAQYDFGLEFSGGQWSGKEETLLESCLDRGYPLRLHNYFPPSEKPLVMNLSSRNKQIRLDSIKHAQRAIELSEKYGANYYGVHSGFLFDPLVKDLGNKISPSDTTEVNHGFELFLESISTLKTRAEDAGVELAFENNVYSTQLHGNFERIPFLGVDPEQITRISMESGVGLLLDVGHLKVSCKSLGLDWIAAMSSLQPITTGIHLSGNDGIKDNHEPLDRDSPEIQLLKRWPNLKNITTEFAQPTSPESLSKAAEISLELFNE